MMKMSTAIELVWYLATQEAITADHEEILPEHFLAALLRFSELAEDELAHIAPEPNACKSLSGEVAVIRADLTGKDIDTTRLRHELRAKVGNGSRPYRGGQLHRAAASKRLFDSAVQFAIESGSDTIESRHLLGVLLGELVSPGDRRDARPNMPDSDSVIPAGTPLLDKLGGDLICAATEGKSPSVSHRIVEGSALVRVLAAPLRRSVLLITDCDDHARDAVLAAATEIASDTRRSNSGPKRIIDLTTYPPAGTDGTELCRLMAPLLTEAAHAEGTVLFVPSVEAPLGEMKSADWLQLLRSTPAIGQFQFICRVSPRAFHRSIKNNLDWQRRAHVMWIGAPSGGDVPCEF